MSGKTTIADAEAIRALPPRKFKRGDFVYNPWMGHCGRVHRSKVIMFHAEDGTPVPMRRVIYWIDHWRKDWIWEDCLELVRRKR